MGLGEWFKKEIILEGLRKEMIWCYIWSQQGMQQFSSVL